jgi:hypothetical protein
MEADVVIWLTAGVRSARMHLNIWIARLGLRFLRIIEETPFHLKKMDLKPGDLVVFETELVLDRDQVKAIKARLDEALKPLGASSIVVTCGATLRLVESDEPAAME